MPRCCRARAAAWPPPPWAYRCLGQTGWPRGLSPGRYQRRTSGVAGAAQGRRSAYCRQRTLVDCESRAMRPNPRATSRPSSDMAGREPVVGHADSLRAGRARRRRLRCIDARAGRRAIDVLGRRALVPERAGRRRAGPGTRRDDNRAGRRRPEVHRALRGLWTAFNARLQVGDQAGALAQLTSSLRSRFERVFQRLGTALSGAAAGLGSIQLIDQVDSLAEAAVLQNEDGVTRLYFRLLPSVDGQASASTSALASR
jgi:hypothetical protein